MSRLISLNRIIVIAGMETELRELIAKKDDIEEEIKHLNHKCESIDKEKCKNDLTKPSPKASSTMKAFHVQTLSSGSWRIIGTASDDSTN